MDQRFRIGIVIFVIMNMVSLFDYGKISLNSIMFLAGMFYMASMEPNSNEWIQNEQKKRNSRD